MPDPQPSYQYIKLPDGSYGKFLSSASDDQIKSAITKDFPKAYLPQPTLANNALSVAKGFGGQALKIAADPGMSQMGTLPQPSDQDITNPNLNPFSSEYSGNSVGNILGNTVAQAKQANPIAPFLNNPNTMEGAGQSLANLVALRNLLRFGKGKVGTTELPSLTQGAGETAAGSEVVQPLTRVPKPSEGPTTLSNVDALLSKVKNAMDQKYGPNKWGEQETPTQVQNVEEMLKKSLDAVRAKKSAPQGGHAGGGVTSVEELNRPGVNYVVKKSGALTYQGKSFDPGSTPSGATHVTVLPNGNIRVNAGPQLNPSQILSLRTALAQ